MLGRALHLMHSAGLRFDALEFELSSQFNPAPLTAGWDAWAELFKPGHQFGRVGPDHPPYSYGFRFWGLRPDKFRCQRGNTTWIACQNTVWVYRVDDPVVDAYYNPERSTIYWLDAPVREVLDPACLLPDLEILSVTEGQEALWIRAVARSLGDIGPDDYALLMPGASEYRLAIHPSRGVILSAVSLWQDQVMASYQVSGLRFDAHIPREIFVPPAGKPVREQPPLH